MGKTDETASDDTHLPAPAAADAPDNAEVVPSIASAPATDATDAADGATPVTIACGCRRTIEDPAVISEPRYSWWATATLLFGVTAPPKSVDFRCLGCSKVIATRTDAATIRRHIHG